MTSVFGIVLVVDLEDGGTVLTTNYKPLLGEWFMVGVNEQVSVGGNQNLGFALDYEFDEGDADGGFGHDM